MNPAYSAARRCLPIIVAVSFVAIFVPPKLGAIEVDRAELDKSSSSRIVFINYEGPHTRIETREDIRGIGLALGRAIRAGATRAGSTNRYFAVHSVSTASGDKLDADILGIGVDAGVDHVRNLRLILQGYLEGAYEYTASDAALLAQFITIYNAVFRGNWDYFGQRYKDGVLAELTKDTAGLSVRFDEWPGRARIVIPLAEAKAGSLSALDTTSLTEKKVIDEMRADESKGIEQRKDMVNLKEREAADAKQTATLEREAIAQEEAKIAEERAKIEAEKKQVAEKEQAATKEAPTTTEEGARTTTTGAEKQAGAEKDKAATEAKQTTKEETAAAKEEIAQKEAALAEREKALQDKKEAAAADEAFAEKKQVEAKQERSDIAKDQQNIIAEETKKAAETPAPTGSPAVQMLDQTSPMGRVILVDVSTGAEVASSALNTVRPRAFLILANRIVAIAGQATGTGAVRLVSLNPKTLEMTKQGEDDIEPNSLIWVNGADLYAITTVGGARYLARFDMDLMRQARSQLAVHPFATPIFQNGTLTTQAADGSVLVLNAKDLTRKGGSK